MKDYHANRGRELTPHEIAEMSPFERIRLSGVERGRYVADERDIERAMAKWDEEQVWATRGGCVKVALRT